MTIIPQEEFTEEDKIFIEQFKKLVGKDEKGIRDDLDTIFKKMEFDPELTVSIELHTGIMDSSFVGLKISMIGKSDNTTYVIKPISGGYSFKATKNKDQIFDLKYTKSKGATSTTRTTTHKLSGTVYNGKTAKNINSTLEIIENVVVDVREVKVKDSIKVANMGVEDINTIITNLDKYPKLKALLTPYIDQYTSSLIPSTECDPESTDCISVEGEETPVDNIEPTE